MNEVYLTVSDVAKLKGCSERYIRRIAGCGEIAAETLEIRGRGHASNEYRIPLFALDKKLQVKYKKQQIKAVEARLTHENL